MLQWPDEKNGTGAPEGGEEVSMEEILASIRKIITSDEEGGEGESARPGSDPQALPSLSLPKEALQEEAFTLPPHGEDILELVEEPLTLGDEEVMELSCPPEEAQRLAEPMPPLAAQPEASLAFADPFSLPSDDFSPSAPEQADTFKEMETLKGKSLEELLGSVDLGFSATSEEEPAQALPQDSLQGFFPSEEESAPNAAKEEGVFAPQASSSFFPSEEAPSAHEVRTPEPPSRSLVDAATEAATLGALDVLHHTLKKKDDPAPLSTPPVSPLATLTVEALVLQAMDPLLRSMLKQWMDQNLSHLVESIVKAEIAKIVAQSGH